MDRHILLAELQNLANGSKSCGDDLAVRICIAAIKEIRRLYELVEAVEPGIDDYWRTLPEHQGAMESVSRILEVTSSG